MTPSVEKLIEKINSLEKEKAELSSKVNIEPEYGIPNLKVFKNVLEREWGRAARSGEPLALILLELDQFKTLTTSFSKVAAHNRIKKVLKIIQDNLQRPADFFAHFDKGKFAIILPETTAEGAQQLTEQLRSSIASLKIVYKRTLNDQFLTVSIGLLGTIPSTKSSSETFFHQALNTLYQAKLSGGNCVNTAVV
jgi:diguanylate cyclase (GGDEF)-like protein